MTKTIDPPIFYQLFRRGQYIKYEQFNTVGHTRYRITIRRDSYDDQSYGMAEMFMVGYGWAEVFRTEIDFLDETKELSYVELPTEKRNPLYQEKHTRILLAMSKDAKKILGTALDIVGQ